MYKQHEIVLLESNEPSHIHFIPKGEYEKIGEDLVSIKENRLLFEEESSEYSYTPMHLYIY